MECVINRYDKRMLEFELLEEVKEVGSDRFNDISGNLYEILDKISDMENVAEVIRKMDDSLILYTDGRFLLTDNIPNAEVGDIYAYRMNRYMTTHGEGCHMIKLANELKNIKEFDELFIDIDKWVEEDEEEDKYMGSRGYNNDLISIGDENIRELTFKIIKDKINAHRRERRQRS